MASELDAVRMGEMPHWEPADVLGTMTLSNLLFSNDYRHIALKGILTSVVMLGLGGLMAMLFRTELALPDLQLIDARPYMSLMTLHGMLMVFGFIIPLVIALNYYMMPKVLGTGQLLLAGAAQWSYWTLILAAVALVIARPDFTWTFYPPMSLRVGGDLVWLGYVAIALVAVSEFLAGAVLMRNGWEAATRLGWGKLPLMGWGAISEGILLLGSTPILGLVGIVMLTDWLELTAMFDPARGGDVMTFMYMFWFYGHPAVYLPLMPAIAVLYTLLPRFLGRPVWSYWSAVIAFSLLTVLGFIVYPHHFQPAENVSGLLQRAAQLLTLAIFIPSTLHVFNWIASLWSDEIPRSARRAIPFKFLIASIFFLMLGGVTAYVNAQIATDSAFVHNTYFVPAHFHAMFAGFMANMAMAGIYFLYPYFTGRMYSQVLGNLHFWSWQIGIFTKVMMMYYLGYVYFPRWVVDYLDLPQWSGAQLALTGGAYLIGLGFIVFVVNMMWSASRGAKATDDPWAVDAEPGAGAAPVPAE
ncbi:MAG: cbb3-type cytochrome c oxidase subunit I [Paracoccaceae bacterium]|nr:cbb3-type cytochrome c oxidase subunit I [Paracoccaceae bacterium]